MNATLPPHEDPELLARALERTAVCPPLERLAAAALGDLDPAAAALVAEHARGCPACAAELALARGFEAEPAPSAEIDGVVDRLRGGQPATGARVVEFRPRSAPRPAASRSYRWAAAAMLVLGLGLAWQATRSSLPPDLVGPGGSGVVRGGEIEPLSPIGETAGAPAEIVWTAVPGAARYRVELLDVAGDRLGGGETSATTFALSAELRARLLPRARYGWRVVALAADGSETARSETVEFEVRPSAAR